MMTTLEHTLQRLFGWPTTPPAGIDFGNGAQLGAEDVLETHFQRLARTRTVPIQVGDNLVGAIAVLAPQLAPLTLLAEDVAYALPPVQPASTFRTTLHHALEQTHRQHTAQRMLGTRLESRACVTPRPHGARILIAVLLGLCALAIGTWFFAPKRRSLQSE